MKNNTATFLIEDSKVFKIKMLNWSGRFNIFCFLDSGTAGNDRSAFDYLLAAGCKRSVSITHDTGLEALQVFADDNKEWLFGHLGYDVLNKKLPQKKFPGNDVDFGDGFFFIPEILLHLKDNKLTIESDHPDKSEIFNAINGQDSFIKRTGPVNIEFEYGISRDEYKTILNDLKGHILRGDCYEINFCQHFYATGISIDPAFYYYRLSEISPNPYSAFYRINDTYCLCASPERFLKKSGKDLFSQPIKGTGKRDLSNAASDLISKERLMNSEKERSENVMIVDLVRNDLSKICMEGSVKVKELFGIYSFPQVHQMISTIGGTVNPSVRFIDIIKACFPMGSMTGAPKIKVMELISKYEHFTRGLFSGSIGYITPNGDFDFNVVIRSLFFDESKKTISFKAGGGITFNSDAEQEYEECMLKAEAIISVLKNV